MNLEPDIKLSDLLLLAKLGALFESHGTKLSQGDVARELDVTKDRIRNALDRMKAALVDVEDEHATPRNFKPTSQGRNIGGAGVLANLLIEISTDKDTDQERLMLNVKTIIDRTQADYEAGHFRALNRSLKF